MCCAGYDACLRHDQVRRNSFVSRCPPRWMAAHPMRPDLPRHLRAGEAGAALEWFDAKFLSCDNEGGIVRVHLGDRPRGLRISCKGEPVDRGHGHSSCEGLDRPPPPSHLATGASSNINRAAARAGPWQGNSRSALCGRSQDRRPRLDRDCPGRTNGNAVSNPRIRV
jgi:hypothetical protein